MNHTLVLIPIRTALKNSQLTVPPPDTSQRINVYILGQSIDRLGAKIIHPQNMHFSMRLSVKFTVETFQVTLAMRYLTLSGTNKYIFLVRQCGPGQHLYRPSWPGLLYW